MWKKKPLNLTGLKSKKIIIRAKTLETCETIENKVYKSIEEVEVNSRIEREVHLFVVIVGLMVILQLWVKKQIQIMPC